MYIYAYINKKLFPELKESNLKTQQIVYFMSTSVFYVSRWFLETIDVLLLAQCGTGTIVR